ncbi:hypothetical protein OIU78_022333 [Salix suchowensis]|nr:hypothetical protein OIU78_022333 [Salix suchowensis]
MEGAPPSSVEDDVNFTLNQLELDTLISELSWLPPEEVPVNQSSMLCNDQAGQNMLVDNNDSIQFPTSFPQTMTSMGGLDGTSSSCINQNGPNWPQTPSSDQQWTNQLSMRNQVSGMLVQPQPPMNQWSPQFSPSNLQVSGDHDLFNSNCYDSTLFEPTSSSRSQMEKLQVRGLQNQNARPNASNPGPDSSMQSQNRVLNTQQVRSD